MQEHDFILNYARLSPDEFYDFEGLDWHYICNQSNAHKLTPLIYNNIKNLPVPPEILNKFEQIYTFTAFHNMLYAEEMQKILQKLNNEGIKAVILKGLMLAQNIYRNIALRPFSDIDILIKKEDLGKTVLTLKSAGYISENEIFYTHYHFHLPLFKPGKIPFNIELHWDIADNFMIHKVNINKILNESINNTMPDTANILYLLLHIEKHAFFNKAIYDRENPRDWIFTQPSGNQIIWFTDVYELIKKSNINIENLINLAKEWCIENCVYYNLYILNKLYPLKSLEDLPMSKLGSFKRYIYKLALKRENKFSIEHGIQLRPIRAIDLVNYLFPPQNIIKNYYCKKNKISVMLLYIFHFFLGTGNIIFEFIGIFKQKLRLI